MKDKIKQLKKLEKEFHIFAKNKWKEYFRSKLTKNDRVSFEGFILTKDDNMKIFYSLNHNKIEHFIVEI